MMTRTLFFLLFFLVLVPAAGAGPANDFNQGWHAFHDLCKDSKKSRYRSHWMKVKEYFSKAYKASPSGSYAPKSLYYLGRTYEELGKRSYLKSDFKQAIDYYQRQINRFNDHSWTDDAQLRKAMVYYEYLKDPSQAYIEFLKVVHNHPQGDMRKEAEKYLNKMDSRQAGKLSTKERKELLREAQQAEDKTEDKIEDKDPEAEKDTGGLKLEKIRHWSTDDYTRVVLDLNRETEYRHKLLKPDPELGTSHRLFIDLSGTRLGRDAPRKDKIADGILERVRAAQYRQDKARVVLDIQKLDKFRVFSLQNPFRIVVDVYAPGEKNRQQATERITLDGAGKELARENLLEQLGLTIETIMIDPGHGGKDPGAVSNGILEKDINLRMSRVLGDMLEEEGFRVLYTRTDDSFLPLEERTAMANSKKADLFISIHCNAHNSRKMRGFEVYYLNLAKSKDAVRVAARENSISEKKISDLQYILTDLMLNSKISESRDLAGSVHKTALNAGRQVYSSLNDHGVREAPFYVLMGAQMPAILLELGYLTNDTDRAHLKSDKFLTRMAQGLVDGVVDYRKKMSQYATLSED
ncbi:MAG: N-acetylmuramoyl-L-alanine amidase [Desulfonatronovibrionaceae bacterium]